MKQTAIEWLEEQMKTWGDLPRWMRDDIVEKAKAMEKEQIIEANENWMPFISGNEYYNETFKKEDLNLNRGTSRNPK